MNRPPRTESAADKKESGSVFLCRRSGLNAERMACLVAFAAAAAHPEEADAGQQGGKKAGNAGQTQAGKAAGENQTDNTDQNQRDTNSTDHIHSPFGGMPPFQAANT